MEEIKPRELIFDGECECGDKLIIHKIEHTRFKDKIYLMSEEELRKNNQLNAEFHGEKSNN